MESTAIAQDTLDYGSSVKQAVRAADLVGHTVVVLRDNGGARGMSEVIELLAEAVAVLSKARNTPSSELLALVIRANGLLGDALTSARDVKRAPDSAFQALEAVRSAVLLLNGITRHAGMTVLPPPLPGGRRSLEPPAGLAERRKTPRAFLETEITFESTDNFYTGFTEDISEGGLFLVTYDLRPIGTEVEIELSLPTGHIVRALSTVRWVRDPRDDMPDAPPGMGLQFRNLLPEDRTAIHEFIEARTPLFYED